MTREEWVKVEALIASEWPHARVMSRDQVVLRHKVVEDLDADVVVEEVVRFAREGREFPPTPGQLYAAITAAERPAVPSPGQVLQLIRRAAGKFGRSGEAAALRWLSFHSPYAARFAVEHGWRELCMEQLDDPEHGGAVRARIERSIASTTSGLEGEYRRGQVRALVGERVRQLEAGGGVRRGLHQLNPGWVLPERPELEEGKDDITEDET